MKYLGILDYNPSIFNYTTRKFMPKYKSKFLLESKYPLIFISNHNRFFLSGYIYYCFLEEYGILEIDGF